MTNSPSLLDCGLHRNPEFTAPAVWTYRCRIMTSARTGGFPRPQEIEIGTMKHK